MNLYNLIKNELKEQSLDVLQSKKYIINSTNLKVSTSSNNSFHRKSRHHGEEFLQPELQHTEVNMFKNKYIIRGSTLLPYQRLIVLLQTACSQCGVETTERNHERCEIVCRWDRGR